MADYEFSQTKLEPADSVQMLAINGTSPGYLTGAELKDFIANQMPSGVPIGTIVPYGGNSLPNGFLDCNGAAVSRTTYDVLFSIIGTSYGEGDGYSTFNLPNLTGRFLEGGAEAGEYKEAGLPNIEGQYSVAGDVASAHNTSAVTTGAYTTKPTVSSNAYKVGSNQNGNGVDIAFDASLANPIYGNSDTVQPASLVVRYVIKAYDYNADPTPVSEFESQIATLTSQVGALQQRTVVEFSESGTPSSGNYIWVRRWSDGWLELGGSATWSTGATVRSITATFPYPFKDTKYTVAVTAQGTTGQPSSLTYAGFINKSTTSCFMCCASQSTSYTHCTGIDWYATGMGATI